MRSDLENWFAGQGELFVKEIAIKKGHMVLDFGCGVGHYTIPIAKVVGQHGKMYAVEKDKEALTQLMDKAHSEGLENIVPETISGELKINVETDSIDVVLLYDVLHYIPLEKRSSLYNVVHRLLKAEGILSIYPKHHKLDEHV